MYAVQLPKRVVFGEGIEEKIGAEAKGLDAKKKHLLLPMQQQKKTGSLEEVEKPLKEALELDIFDKVESELTLAVAETVAEAARVNGILNIEISKK